MLEERTEDIREVATELLRQGERCALAGLLLQAEAILMQVWTITEERAPDLANAAAWEVAWLLLRRRAYIDATEWFSRIVAPLSRESELWPAAQQVLVRMCLALANDRSEPAATPHLPLRTQPISTDDLQSLELPPLKVMNLGQFKIVRAEKVLPLCRMHKAMSLLRYLLTRIHRVAYKEELMELLWPDVHPQEAKNSLHVAVSTLRRYLDPATSSYLLFEDGRYMINPSAPVEDDCASFRQLNDEGHKCWEAGDLFRAQQAYISAIAYYQGDYYVDNRDFAWAVAEQERLLMYYLSALDHLGQIFITQGQFQPAIECYQRLLDRDGYREDAHCKLMRCYWQLNRRGDALRQYKRCSTILANDLGLEPMPETQTLYGIISGVGVKR